MGTMINRIVESMMTADEQVELMRLEDEVAQSCDEVEAAIVLYRQGINNNNSSFMQLQDMRDELIECELVKIRCENNLKKYISRVERDVLDRILHHPDCNMDDNCFGKCCEEPDHLDGCRCTVCNVLDGKIDQL